MRNDTSEQLGYYINRKYQELKCSVENFMKYIEKNITIFDSHYEPNGESSFHMFHNEQYATVYHNREADKWFAKY